MTVRRNEVGTHGTLSGPLGQFTGIVKEYRPSRDEHDTFVFLSDNGGEAVLRVRDWVYVEDVPPISSGWYSDPEHPTSEGYNPVYVAPNGDQFVVGNLNRETLTFSAVPVKAPIRELATIA